MIANIAWRQSIIARHLPQPVRTRLRCPLLRLAVDRDQAKLGFIAAHPFIIVKRGPAAIAADVDTGGQAVGHAAQGALDVFQAPRMNWSEKVSKTN